MIVSTVTAALALLAAAPAPQPPPIPNPLVIINDATPDNYGTQASVRCSGPDGPGTWITAQGVTHVSEPAVIYRRADAPQNATQVLYCRARAGGPGLIASDQLGAVMPAGTLLTMYTTLWLGGSNGIGSAIDSRSALTVTPLGIVIFSKHAMTLYKGFYTIASSGSTLYRAIPGRVQQGCALTVLSSLNGAVTCNSRRLSTECSPEMLANP